jgi:hypothetical protein
VDKQGWGRGRPSRQRLNNFQRDYLLAHGRKGTDIIIKHVDYNFLLLIFSYT